MSPRNVSYPKLSVPTVPPKAEDNRALAHIEAEVATEAQSFWIKRQQPKRHSRIGRRSMDIRGIKNIPT